MAYSIWLMSSDKGVQEYLDGVVKGLALEYGGVEFEAHMTLLGDVGGDWEEVKEGCKRLARESKSFMAETGSIEYSTTYYQCVFVRLKPSPELMELYVRAKEVFGLEKPSVLMPHVSLFYGDLEYSKRDEISKAVEFEEQKFLLDTLVVTPSGADVDPSGWEHLYEVKLNQE